MVFSGRSSYGVLAVWVTVLGAFLMLAPDDWYGPSWSYFSKQGQMIVPAGGFGMGLALLFLGLLQMLAIWREGWRMVSLLFFLSGFVFMSAGMLLGAEGLFGHKGLMESPFMLFVGVHKLVISVNASRQATGPQDAP